MRELTFSGFLKGYVRALSYSNTNSIRKLADEAAEQNPRLREPLLLYAFNTRKIDILKSAGHDSLTKYYGSFLDDEHILSRLAAEELPDAYQKVWRSYLSQRDRHEADDETKALMREKILRKQAEKGITNYRIYTGLRLNPGNVNAWLKHGSEDKVSLDTARKILGYVSEL